MITLKVNGETHSLDVEEEMPLLWAIRNEIGLTGTKYGCGIAQCGACTVLMDGKPVRSCSLPVSGAQGREITTIEGLAPSDGRLDPLQDSFLQNGAVQCGFCTPGMILMGRALLSENPNPTEQEIRDHIRGNACRCTGYTQIVKAIEDCKCPPEEA